MKRCVGGAARWRAWVMAGCLLPRLLVAAQDGNAQEYEERYKRLNAVVEELLASQATLQKRIAGLSDEIRALREEQGRNVNQYVRPEDLRKGLEKLAEKVREIDQKREDDRKLILEEIRKLASAPVPEPPARKPKPEKEPDPVPVPAGPQKGYEYQVKSGDTVAAIVTAYQQSGVKVTLSQVLKANPGLNPNRLKVGQKIFIPDPAAP